MSYLQEDNLNFIVKYVTYIQRLEGRVRDVSAAGTTNQLKWKRKILTWVPYIAFLWSRPLREVGELLKATDTDGFYNPFSTHTPAIM